MDVQENTHRTFNLPPKKLVLKFIGGYVLILVMIGAALTYYFPAPKEGDDFLAKFEEREAASPAEKEPWPLK